MCPNPKFVHGVGRALGAGASLVYHCTITPGRSAMWVICCLQDNESGCLKVGCPRKACAPPCKAQRSQLESCQQLSVILPALCSGLQLSAAALTHVAEPSGRLPGCRLCPRAQSPCTILYVKGSPEKGELGDCERPGLAERLWFWKNARPCRTIASPLIRLVAAQRRS